VEDFVATLLVQRGLKLLKTPRTSFVFLRHLHDPYLMKMDKAVARWKQPLKPGKWFFFGDYDVDGTTAVSLVSSY
jgi:single-stranded-DNA-specific exonuclease